MRIKDGTNARIMFVVLLLLVAIFVALLVR